MGTSKTKSDKLEVVRGSGNVFADFGTRMRHSCI
jgi:hypothetical protein